MSYKDYGIFEVRKMGRLFGGKIVKSGCLGLKIISINKAKTYKYSNSINDCHALSTTDITICWYSYSNHKHSVTTVCEVKHVSTQTSIKAFVSGANSSYIKLSVRRGHRYALQISWEHPDIITQLYCPTLVRPTMNTGIKYMVK